MRYDSSIYRLLGVGCLWLLTLQLVAAQPPTPADRLIDDQTARSLRGGRVMLNYENTDIRLLARLMAELTGRNILLDQNAQGQMTVISSREVTPDEAWDIFTLALEAYGFGAFDEGGFTRIMPIKNGRNEYGRVILNPEMKRRGFTVGVIVMKHGDANQIQNALRPLLSPHGVLQPYQPGKAIVVADQASVVSRIAAVARHLDVAHPAQHTSVVFPKYAEAKEIAPILEQLLNPPGVQNDDRVQVKAFEPSNAVITYGRKEDILKVKKLLERLDIPLAAPEDVQDPKFYVYQLKNANAEDVALILSEMLSEKAALQEQRAQINPRAARAAAAEQGGGNQDAAPTTDTGQTGEKLPFVSTKVASDPETNSLILYVSPSQWKDVQDLVAVLDAARKQVLVTAVVAEVSLDRVLQTSAAFQALTPGGIISTFNGGLTEEGLLSFLAGGNFVVGQVGSGSRTIDVNGRDVQVPELFAFIGGQRQNSDFNLISAPRILTEDHKEAEMNVGNVVPFATGARFDNFGNPTITYDYREVGIKLKVTPHVAQSNLIKLEIEQEVQEVTDFLEQNLGGTGYVVPLISNRDVTTTVTVKDGQTLVIGGLISKTTIETMRKIPLLGDIPLLKHLFRETRKEESKSTLFISLTPHIVEQPEMIERIDQPYEEFLKGDRNPRDHQPERRPTEKPEDFVSPYDNNGAPPPPVKLVPRQGPSGDTGPPPAGITVSQLRFLQPLQQGSKGQPMVTVSNGDGESAEVVVIATVRLPDGSRQELKADSLRLSAGQSREVALPAYRVPRQAGVHEIDVSVWQQEQLVGRLALPQRVPVR